MTVETIVVGGAVMTKGLLGILISLGIENWVSASTAYYCYNLISVAIIIFIAAMSGPRSEAAFTIIVPIFAGLFTYFGWLRLATPSQTQGLFYLIVMMGVLGIIMYMNDQNKQNYGVVGPGSKLFNIAIFLALFGACLTLISGFSVTGLVTPSPIVVPGTCPIGQSTITCDQFHNIDVTTTTNSLKSSGSLDVGNAVGWMADNGLKMAVGLINILAGALAFPTILYFTLNGLFPGIGGSAAYAAVLGFLQITVIFIYIIAGYEFFTKAPAGSTL
jgi:hypothetical protein